MNNFIMGKDEQRNLQFECKLGSWSKQRIIEDINTDASDEAKKIRIITQQTLEQKEIKTQQFLQKTQERALLQRRKISQQKKELKSNKKSIIETKQITSFEAARNQATKTKNLLASRFSSP